MANALTWPCNQCLLKKFSLYSAFAMHSTCLSQSEAQAQETMARPCRCMAVSFFSFMALVQTEPLSFAVPASAASFILETVLAKFVLKEHVGVRQAAGTLIVLAGVVLLGE